MKWLLFFLLLFFEANGQEYACKHSNEIAKQESRTAYARLNALQTQSSSNFEIFYSNCVWKVDPAVRFIEGKVTHYFSVNTATNSISFDLAFQLTVDSIVFRNVKMAFSQTANHALHIQLGSTLAAQQKDSVIIFYKGIPPQSGFGSFIQTTHNNVPVIWTLSEPYGSKDWWPCRNGLDDKIDSIDITIIHPSIYTATTNGVKQSAITNNNQTVTWYKHRFPITSYLVAFSVTNFTTFSHTIPLGNLNLPMITHVYPESLAIFQNNTAPAIECLKLLHESYGPYPYITEQYGHTQFGWGGGMEHQTNSFLSFPDVNLMAHEIAHQWFGNKITCGSWQDIWINEGFATFSSNYFFENYDTAILNSLLTIHLNNITSQPDGSVYVQDTTDVYRIFSGRLSYDKGSYALRMLRFTLGDSIFFKALKQFLNDPLLKNGFAKTTDFKRNIEQVAGQDLTYFFNQWIYGEGYPSFAVQWNLNNNHWAKVKVTQTTSHPSVTFYKTPLPITFKKGTQQKTVVVQCNTNGAETWVNVGFAADTVLVDLDKQLISKNNSTQKIINTNSLVNDIQLYPNPVKNNVFISIKNPSFKQLQVQLFNAQGQLLKQQQFITNGQDEVLQLPLTQYPKGNYIIQLLGQDFKLVKKLLK
jgi:aminopeptidase N